MYTNVCAITSNNNNDNDHSFVHCDAESDPVANQHGNINIDTAIIKSMQTFG